MSILSALSGSIGDIVVRRTRHGIVVASRPARRKKKPRGGQKKANDKFRDAVRHAKKVLAEFKRDNPGAKTVKRGKSIYHIALAEYLRKK